MFSRYITAALVTISLAVFFYYLNFGLILEYEISNKTEDWAHFGSYTGGLLGPLLSFITIMLLIKSLGLQKVANQNLKDELEDTRRTEKLRSFDSMFFNMIESQKRMFEDFEITARTSSEEITLYKTDAVDFLQEAIEEVNKGTADTSIEDVLNDYDPTDRIYDLTRSFYICALLIKERLTDQEGFTSEERKSHYKVLIHFTEIAHLEAISIAMKHKDFYACHYLKNNDEFNEVIDSLGLDFWKNTN